MESINLCGRVVLVVAVVLVIAGLVTGSGKLFGAADAVTAAFLAIWFADWVKRRRAFGLVQRHITNTISTWRGS